tara:strand:- start:241 stop:660 length:420 start_codon:yes stop_codon:yes gene_type:complete
MKLGLLLSMLLVSLFIIGCSKETPNTNHNISQDIQIKNMKLIPEIISTTEKSTITLNIKSDMNGSIHFHGYNIESELFQNKITILEINLSATGSFPIALHKRHNHSSHTASNSGGHHDHGSDKKEHEEDIIGKLIVNPR